MKYSKKVVNVPESEYKALIGLLSGNSDPLSREKYETDVKIQQNFRKPMLTQLEKNVKYQSLNRKRKKLAKMIQNKPLKIVVENAKTERPAPTEGIAPSQKPKNNIQDAQQNVEPPQNIEAEGEQNVYPQVDPAVKGVLDDFKGVIKQDFYEQLNDYINENKIKFGITNNGGILSNKARDTNPINGSNFIKVIKFMTGKSELEKWETRYAGGFIKRLLKDQRVNEFIEQSKDQEGQGFAKRKRFLVQLKTKPIKEAKTKGLIRAFKPVLWTKIPV